jgi:proteasome accessory factor C
VSAPKVRGPRPVSTRLRRLLVMLPWLMERGEVTVAEAAERFGVSEAHLIADLERASLCGLPPYVDEMIDLFIDDGVIHMGVPRLFTRPLRLNAREGFSLLAAGKAALEMPGADVSGPLARALAKLEVSLGTNAVVSIDVEHPPMLDAVRSAVDERAELHITYYASWRDETTTRVIRPHTVFSEQADWYVIADCDLAGGQRHFRVDRIVSLDRTGNTFEHRTIERPGPAWFSPSPDTTLVTLRLDSSAGWVTLRYPMQAVRHVNDHIEADLLVVSVPWLERLLLRLGPAATVLSPTEWASLGRTAAARQLKRYTK